MRLKLFLIFIYMEYMYIWLRNLFLSNNLLDYILKDTTYEVIYNPTKFESAPKSVNSLKKKKSLKIKDKDLYFSNLFARLN